MIPGEDTGWEVLSGLKPHGVCKDAAASYDAAKGLYILKSFGQDIYISPGTKEITGRNAVSDVLLKDLAKYSRLSFIWYLTGAKDIPLSGRLVRPDHLKGGHLFSRGTHVLPLESLANKYSNDIDGFLLKGGALGAEKVDYGDAAVRLSPVPRIPVTLILWRGDSEFPPMADLLFDSTCEFHAPIDILWSIAMMCIKIMM